MTGNDRHKVADRQREADAPSPAEGEHEGPLARWARRKQTAKQPLPASESRSTSESPADAPLELPAVDSLDATSDYSAFLDSRVSEELQRLALRKLFHLPEFNVTDGLNDYDEDFSHHSPLGGLVTREMRRVLAREAARHQPTSGAAEEISPDQDPDRQAASSSPDQSDAAVEPKRDPLV